nr:plastocyanin/azurin family copper-binding protein [Actinoplanes lichenis]
MTQYKSVPTSAVAGETTVIFENSTATGNTTGMPHTLTFDTSTPGYNHDVSLSILANPFDTNNGRHTATVTLTEGRYRFYCTIPGHSSMVGELVVGGSQEPDTMAPTVSATVAGDNTTSATVTVSATDASGVGSIEYQLDDGAWTPYTAPVVVTAAGSHVVRSRATDNAGNTSEPVSVSFTVAEPDPDDETAPTVTAQVSGTRNDDGNYVGSAIVTVTATDDDSGVARVEVQIDGGAWTAYTQPVVISTPGAHVVGYRATDNAGNTSATASSSFTIAEPEPDDDETAPTVTAQVTGARDDDGNYVGSATVTVTATDDDSGVARVEVQIDGGAWTAYTQPVVLTTVGMHMVHYRATDNAGNTSAEQMAHLTVVASGPGGDECPGGDTRATVFLGGADTGVPNADTGNGCTVSDLIDEDAGYPTHAAFVRHVESVTNGLVAAGTLTARQAGTLVRAAARS